jgi:hypothetical protein
MNGLWYNVFYNSLCSTSNFQCIQFSSWSINACRASGIVDAMRPGTKGWVGHVFYNSCYSTSNFQCIQFSSWSINVCRALRIVYAGVRKQRGGGWVMRLQFLMLYEHLLQFFILYEDYYVLCSLIQFLMLYEHLLHYCRLPTPFRLSCIRLRVRSTETTRTVRC